MKIIIIVFLIIVASVGIYYYSTKNKVVSEVFYYIGKEKVTKEVFMDLKNQLTIDIGSVISANFETEPRVYGGYEEHYIAVKKDDNKVYDYTVLTFANGNVSYSIVGE
jgi:hypothetical protein